MMKRSLKFITIPVMFWDNPQLSLRAKCVAVAIDSYTDSADGCPIGVRALQSATNLSAKEVKDSLLELKDKGCMTVNLSPDGQKLLKVNLYKESYHSSGYKPVEAETPNNAELIDYAYIQEQWNSLCGKLPRVDRFTPKRKQKTRTALRGVGCSTAELIKAMKLIQTSSFLRGDKGDWSATYDWMVKSAENLTKILEGNYHKDFAERQAFEAIMSGNDMIQTSSKKDNFYQ